MYVNVGLVCIAAQWNVMMVLTFLELSLLHTEFDSYEASKMSSAKLKD